MTYDAGRSRAIYEVQTSQAEAAIQRVIRLYADMEAAQRRATRPTSLPALGGGGGPATGGASRAPSFAQETRAQAALEAQQARLARVQGDTARAAELEAQAQQRLTAALVRTDTTTAQAIGLQRQLATVQTQAARGTQQVAASQTQAGGATSAFVRGLVGFAAPAAVAGIALGTLARAGESFRDAFVFKAQLDEQTRSVQNQLQGIRDTGQTFAEAQRFADRYKLTQEETTTAIRESLPVLRESRASTEQTLSVLSRLRVRNPLEDVAGAARAVSELQAGQILSLVNRFNLPRAEINKLNAEIKNGGDAVLLLDKYLNRLGLTEATLATQTQGASGALRDQAQAQEQVRLAQARVAESAGGVAFVEEQAQVYRGLANVLNGQIAITGQSRLAYEHYFNVIRAGLGDVQALIALEDERRRAEEGSRDAIAQRAGAVALAAATDFQAGQAAAARATAEDEIRQQRHLDIQATQEQQAAIARLTAGLGEQAAAHTLAAQQAALLKQREDGITSTLAELTSGTINQAQAESILTGRYGVNANSLPGLIALTFQLADARAASARADLAARGARPPTNLTEARLPGGGAGTSLADRLGGGAGTDARRALAEQGRIRDAQNALDLARAKTAAQRIAILEREKAATTDVAEKIRIQAQIESERNSGAKAHTTELDKQLGLNERIRDSLESQLKASIDARKLAAQDTLDRLKEDQQLAQARRVLATSHDDRFRQAAQARIDLIGAERDERTLARRQAEATAGGALVNGRVFQSLPGGGAPQPIPALPLAGGAPSAVQGATGGLPSGLQVLVLLDGEQIAAKVETRVVSGLRQSRQQSVGSGGGVR